MKNRNASKVGHILAKNVIEIISKESLIYLVYILDSDLKFLKQ